MSLEVYCTGSAGDNVPVPITVTLLQWEGINVGQESEDRFPTQARPFSPFVETSRWNLGLTHTLFQRVPTRVKRSGREANAAAPVLTLRDVWQQDFCLYLQWICCIWCRKFVTAILWRRKQEFHPKVIFATVSTALQCAAEPVCTPGVARVTQLTYCAIQHLLPIQPRYKDSLISSSL